jgi:hypothetical protein
MKIAVRSKRRHPAERQYASGMRKVLAAVLFALTGAGLMLAAIVLSHLFDDYKDSPDSMFIETAAVPLALGLMCLAGGVSALREPPR